MTDEESNLAELSSLHLTFEQKVPFNRALGLVPLVVRRGHAVMRLPYRLELVGNPDTGVLHGGAITSLMDACAGIAVFMSLDEPVPVATLDLRVDYMLPAEPGLDVLGEVECYKTTRNVAFVKGLAYHDDPADPIATLSGSFMIGTKGGR